MKSAAGLLLSLTAVQAVAATAYVTDELVLGLYADENNQGQRLATLHSGAVLETLDANGEFTRVRMPDGTTGWVKTTYLTANEPAVVRIKQLQEELDRAHATTPALAEAAARNELAQLKQELEQARAAATVVRPPEAAAGASGTIVTVAAAPSSSFSAPAVAGAFAAALVGGFWLGYATLARRVRSRFGGLKVY